MKLTKWRSGEGCELMEKIPGVMKGRRIKMELGRSKRFP